VRKIQPQQHIDKTKAKKMRQLKESIPPTDVDTFCDNGERCAISMCANPENIKAITLILWNTTIPGTYFMQSDHQNQQASLQCQIYRMCSYSNEEQTDHQPEVITQFFTMPTLNKILSDHSLTPTNKLSKAAFLYGFLTFLTTHYKKQVSQATNDLVNSNSDQIPLRDILADLKKDPTTGNITLLTWLIKTKRQYSLLHVEYSGLKWKGNNTLFGGTSCSEKVTQQLNQHAAIKSR